MKLVTATELRRRLECHDDLLDIVCRLIADCESEMIDTDEMSDDWKQLYHDAKVVVAKVKGGA